MKRTQFFQGGCSRNTGLTSKQNCIKLMNIMLDKTAQVLSTAFSFSVQEGFGYITLKNKIQKYFPARQIITLLKSTWRL